MSPGDPWSQLRRWADHPEPETDHQAEAPPPWSRRGWAQAPRFPGINGVVCVCCFILWMFVLTWHTRASSEFSVRVKWLLFVFPRIETFGGAENNLKLFILYYIQFFNALVKNTQKVFLFSLTIDSNVCWWAEPDRGNECLTYFFCNLVGKR